MGRASPRAIVRSVSILGKSSKATNQQSFQSSSLRSSTSSADLGTSARSHQESTMGPPMTFSSPMRPPPTSSIAAGKRKLDDAADEIQEPRKRATHDQSDSVDLSLVVQDRRNSFNSSTNSLAEHGELSDPTDAKHSLHRDLSARQISMIAIGGAIGMSMNPIDPRPSTGVKDRQGQPD